MRIAVLDDEIIVCRRLSQALTKDAYDVEAFTTAESFLAKMRQNPFDIVFSDLKLKDGNGIDILAKTKSVREETEVIIITGYASIETAIEAIKEGAYHYVTKPFNMNEIRLLAKSASEKIELRMENLRLREALKGGTGLHSILGVSQPMQDLFSMIRKLAPVDCNVILQGASGTGKALVAKAIHQLSRRKDSHFVSFNCGGFTDELIASELFGYEKGAFTGATASKVGLLESATGGTVFLDEIGEMPLSMQVKLLHVIQDRSILRVGGVRPIDLDIRVIAATNRDLRHEVAIGNFREDLFYRLNVVMLHLPSLDERREDILILINHFMEKFSLAFHKKVSDIQPHALQILMNYTYPGNVRELENIVERAVALTDCEMIRAQDLPQDLQQLEFDNIEGEGLVTLAEIEKRYISRILEKTGYNKAETAQILDIPRTTLWRKLKSYKIG